MLALTRVVLFLISLVTCANSSAETINIATVNNGDFHILKELSHHFIKSHPDISIEWDIFDENTLRNTVTKAMSSNVPTAKNDYDVVTLGMYEVQMWAKNQWLRPIRTFSKQYALSDIFPPIKYGLSWNNTLYALPFYAEGAMVMYRSDLLSKANLTMPKKPNWEFIKKAARAMHDPKNGINGICLRGKPGWGENMALLTAMANSYGARWFDENWQPQFDSDEWRNTLIRYYSLLKLYGPEIAHKNGFNENLKLFQQGKCALWIDATVAGSFVTDETTSLVANKTSFALAPHNGLGKNSNWLWSWSLAIPSKSTKAAAADKFIRWATSQEYIQLVAKYKGWKKVPPGTRKSLYKNQDYVSISPFANVTLETIKSANSIRPTVKPVPYSGIQYVAIPEFQAIGTEVGKIMSSLLAGEIKVREALQLSQNVTKEIMTSAGYIAK